MLGWGWLSTRAQRQPVLLEENGPVLTVYRQDTATAEALLLLPGSVSTRDQLYGTTTTTRPSLTPAHRARQRHSQDETAAVLADLYRVRSGVLQQSTQRTPLIDQGSASP